MTQVSKIAPEAGAEIIAPVDPMISMIERIAMDPAADLDKLERMLQLKEQHEAREAKAMFAAAFARAASEFPTIPLRGKGHNGKPYATLEDITKYTRPVLSEHGLALNFACDVGEQVIVTAKLTHAAGHSETTSMALPRDTSGSKNAVQAVGSTQKYGQRYTAQAILGLSLGEDDEDDGRGAGEAPKYSPKGGSSWEQIVVQDLPDGATPRQRAEAISEAICAQWKRKKSVKQIDNEWDRRDEAIQRLQERHPDLFAVVCAAYDERRHHLSEGAA